MRKILFFALAGLLTLGAMSSCEKEDSSVPVVGVKLNPATLSLAPGGSETLTVDFLPQQATNKEVTFASSDAAVATVDAAGLVTAVMNGTATITVTTKDGGKTAICVVTVSDGSGGGGDEPSEPVAVTGVTLSAETLEIEVGQTGSLSATVMPATATNKAVTWSSSDEAVATVSGGTVTAVAVGTATITVTTTDGEKTASAEVTVTPLPDLSGRQNFETDEAGNYKVQGVGENDDQGREYVVNVTTAFTAAGAGYGGEGRALEVTWTVVDDAATLNSHDAQFFFSFAEVTVGKKYKFSMDIKSATPATVETQWHAAPGEYLYWETPIGSIETTTEWQHIEKIITVPDNAAGAKSLAFNLNKALTPNTYYFDNLEFVEVLADLTFEAADETGYTTQGVAAGDSEGRPEITVKTELTAAGGGADGVGKALELTWTIVGDLAPKNAHDVQFFFELGEDVVVGETYTFSMDIKSDTPAVIPTQWHKAPSGYLHYVTPIGNITTTTEWTHFEKTITIPEAAVVDGVAAGALAFNLNTLDGNTALTTPNTFYFDNITWTKP
ncbi:MAG: Ig-like domain-containing protein [Rikenellaceae bacterium]|jgi:hypothetical protein|nr:Ig-like domain-containing protein [Rikenellaceae bacterium]